MIQKSSKMDLLFDQLLNPPKKASEILQTTDTYYGIKFKKCQTFLGFGLEPKGRSCKVLKCVGLKLGHTNVVLSLITGSIEESVNR